MPGGLPGRLLALLLLLGLGLSTPHVLAMQPGEFEVTVFFSKEDPKWPAAEQLLDKTGKDFNIKYEKISFDTPDGYKKLAEAEKDHKLASGGEITVIIGPYHLVSKGEKRDVETYFPFMIARLLKQDNNKGKLNANINGFATEIFGAGATAAKDKSLNDSGDQLDIYKVTKDGKPAGWIGDLYHPIACPICNDVQFMVAMSSPELRVLDVRAVRELEKWGRPLDANEHSVFLAQFKAWAPKIEPPKIQGISHATKTIRGYDKGMRLLLESIRRREAGQADTEQDKKAEEEQRWREAEQRRRAEQERIAEEERRRREGQDRQTEEERRRMEREQKEREKEIKKREKELREREQKEREKELKKREEEAKKQRNQD